MKVVSELELDTLRVVNSFKFEVDKVFFTFMLNYLEQ